MTRRVRRDDRRRRAVVVVALVLASAAAARADTLPYLTRISGVEDEDLLRRIAEVSRLKTLEGQPPASLGALRRRAEKDLERFSKVLRSEGYYDHSIDYRLDTSETPLRVRVRIEPGPPYQLAAFDIVLESDDLEPAMKAVDAALDKAEQGKEARASEIVKTEDLALRELARSGYPFPKLVNRDVVVDHATRTVKVTTRIVTGRRARFGPVTAAGVKQPLAEYARRRVPWKEGDLYDPDQLEKLRARLGATGLFSTIRIEPADAVREDGSLPITLQLARGKLRSIGAGIYYGSSEGPGASAYWEHRDLFGRAERLRIAGDVSKIGQTGKLTFRKPDVFSADQTLVFDAAYEIEDTEAFDSRKFKTSLGLERPFGAHWTVLGGGAFEIGPVDERNDSEDIVLVGLPVNVKRDTTNDLLDPSTGSKLEFHVAPYLEQLGSDVSFVVGRIVESFYFPFDERRRIVLAGRASLGSLQGAGRFDIPADKRFYAGGGGSVRGYGFQLVGPLDQDEDPVGGRSFVEGNVELRWRFMDVLGVVPFIDAGNVFEQVYPSFDDGLFWGAGMGLRYYSPIGPIRLDIATPVNPRDGIDDPVQFYISLGQAF